MDDEVLDRVASIIVKEVNDILEPYGDHQDIVQVRIRPFKTDNNYTGIIRALCNQSILSRANELLAEKGILLEVDVPRGEMIIRERRWRDDKKRLHILASIFFFIVVLIAMTLAYW